MPSNFRTYEAQSRLLAAVIAGHPSLKLNFKEIAKYFGESTPQGIEFQFRAIRKEAKALRDAVDKGESPLTVRRSAGSSRRSATYSATPSKRTAPSYPSTASSPYAAAVTPSARPSKRPRPTPVFSNTDDSSLGDDYEQLDLTPLGTPTPRPMAAVASRPATASVPSTPSASLPPATPQVATTSSSGVPDGTPALSSGATPFGMESPEMEHKYHPAAAASSTAGTVRPHQGESFRVQHVDGREVLAIDDDDDDDDDDEGVFVVDTPSKTPQAAFAAVSGAADMVGVVDMAGMAGIPYLSEEPSSAHMPTPTLGGSFSDWHSFSSGHAVSAFPSFDAGASWAQEDPFVTSSGGGSFAHASQAYYESEGAV